MSSLHIFMQLYSLNDVLLLIYLAIWEECRAAKRHSRSSERLGRRFLQRFPPKSGNLFRLYVGFHYFIGMSLIPP